MQLVLPFDSTSLPLFDASFGSWLSHGRLEGVSLLLLSPRKDTVAAKEYLERARGSKVFDRVNFASVILSDNTITESGLWSAYFRTGPGESFWAPAGTVLLSSDFLPTLKRASSALRAPVIGPHGSVYPAAFYRANSTPSLRPWAINMVKGVHPSLALELAQRLAPKYAGVPEILLNPASREDCGPEVVVAITSLVEVAKNLVGTEDRPRKVGRPPKQQPVAEEPLTEAPPPRIVRRNNAEQPAE
jgi:hypothetical protein